MNTTHTKCGTAQHDAIVERLRRVMIRRLRAAKPRYKSAVLEDVDFKHPRSLNRQQVLSLGSCSWIQDQHNLLITGPTGIGKSFLACAFV